MSKNAKRYSQKKRRAFAESPHPEEFTKSFLIKEIQSKDIISTHYGNPDDDLPPWVPPVDKDKVNTFDDPSCGAFARMADQWDLRSLLK